MESFPLLRFALFRIGPSEHYFVWTQHHLLADGWSTQLAWSEVREIYDAIFNDRVAELPKPRPFRDFIDWLDQQDNQAAESYWRGLLAGMQKATRVQIGQSLTAKSGDYIRCELRLSADQTAKLKRQAQQNRLTLNSACLGAWAFAVSRYSGRDDFVFGFTSSGRPSALQDVDTTVGMLATTQPLRGRFDPDCPAADWLSGLQRQQLESRQFEYASLADIHRWTELPPHEPLLDSLFVFVNYPSGTTTKNHDFGGLRVEDFETIENSSFPLVFLVLPEDELRLILIGDAQRFNKQELDGAAPAFAGNPLGNELRTRTAAWQLTVAFLVSTTDAFRVG